MDNGEPNKTIRPARSDASKVSREAERQTQTHAARRGVHVDLRLPAVGSGFEQPGGCGLARGACSHRVGFTIEAIVRFWDNKETVDEYSSDCGMVWKQPEPRSYRRRCTEWVQLGRNSIRREHERGSAH